MPRKYSGSGGVVLQAHSISRRKRMGGGCEFLLRIASFGKRRLFTFLASNAERQHNYYTKTGWLLTGTRLLRIRYACTVHSSMCQAHHPSGCYLVVLLYVVKSWCYDNMIFEMLGVHTRWFALLRVWQSTCAECGGPGLPLGGRPLPMITTMIRSRLSHPHRLSNRTDRLLCRRAWLLAAGGQVYGGKGGQEVHLRPRAHHQLCGQIDKTID